MVPLNGFLFELSLKGSYRGWTGVPQGLGFWVLVFGGVGRV